MSEHLSGRAPPYGAYRRSYGSYELEQFGSLGSGFLGGWSFEAYGGGFEAPSEAEREMREERERRRQRRNRPVTEGERR